MLCCIKFWTPELSTLILSGRVTHAKCNRDKSSSEQNYSNRWILYQRRNMKQPIDKKIANLYSLGFNLQI